MSYALALALNVPFWHQRLPDNSVLGLGQFVIGNL